MRWYGFKAFTLVFIRYSLILAITSVLITPQSSDAGERVVVYVSKLDLENDWISHLTLNGFQVEANIEEDLESIKEELRVPVDLRGCHTATVGGYFLEGYVPATAIEKLLRSKPEILGLVVIGVPEDFADTDESMQDIETLAVLDDSGKVEPFN